MTALRVSLLTIALTGTVGAQAPMVSDDAAVAPLRRVHFEVFGQSARLGVASLPVLAQQTLVLTMGYGIADRLEVGFDIPAIRLDQASSSALGVGDWNVTAKYLLQSPADTTWPRLAIAAAAELPTGNAARGFGSGVLDVSVNAIGEWGVGEGVVLRQNVGVQFTGNTLTGVIGSPVRGALLMLSSAVDVPLSTRWLVSGEVSGYQGRERSNRDRELRAQGAVRHQLTSHLGVAAAVQRGWLATPRWSFQLGVTLDP